MAEEHFLYETEGGVLLVEGESIILAFAFREDERNIEEAYAWIGTKAKEKGVHSIKVTNAEAAASISTRGIETTPISDEERASLDAKKIAFLVKAGFATGEEKAV